MWERRRESDASLYMRHVGGELDSDVIFKPPLGHVIQPDAFHVGLREVAWKRQGQTLQMGRM